MVCLVIVHEHHYHSDSFSCSAQAVFESSVLVIGCAGAGFEVVLQLIGHGVKRIFLHDDDTLELEDISSCVRTRARASQLSGFGHEHFVTSPHAPSSTRSHFPSLAAAID